MPDETHLPWATQPSGQGSAMCDWCGREIYAPAVPCSVTLVNGLLERETQQGFGARCQYEAITRTPQLLTKLAREPLFVRPRPYPAN